MPPKRKAANKLKPGSLKRRERRDKEKAVANEKKAVDNEEKAKDEFKRKLKNWGNKCYRVRKHDTMTDEQKQRALAELQRDKPTPDELQTPGQTPYPSSENHLGTPLRETSARLPGTPLSSSRLKMPSTPQEREEYMARNLEAQRQLSVWKLESETKAIEIQRNELAQVEERERHAAEREREAAERERATASNLGVRASEAIKQHYAEGGEILSKEFELLQQSAIKFASTEHRVGTSESSAQDLNGAFENAVPSPERTQEPAAVVPPASKKKTEKAKKKQAPSAPLPPRAPRASSSSIGAAATAKKAPVQVSSKKNQQPIDTVPQTAKKAPVQVSSKKNQQPIDTVPQTAKKAPVQVSSKKNQQPIDTVPQTAKEAPVQVSSKKNQQPIDTVPHTFTKSKKRARERSDSPSASPARKRSRAAGGSRTTGTAAQSGGVDEN